MSIETILEQAQALESSYKDQFSVLFKQAFDLYKGKANDIIIQTYTPGFNDGDACNYTIGEIFVNGVTSYGETMSDYGGSYNGVQITDPAELAACKKLASEIHKLVWNFKTFLEKTYGTNVAITIDLVNDTITTEPYDCGY